MRATTGETNVLPFSLGAAAGCAGSARGSGRGRRRLRLAVGGDVADALARRGHGLVGGGLRGRLGGAGASAAGASAPSGAITASFVPTSTVSPSGTRICCRTPVPGLGTSVSTLSVEISSSGSSASIASPSCLSHFVIVPSETDTPIWGMTTSTAVLLSPRATPAS